MSGVELATFLNYLAVVDKVAASTQNQALNAILFYIDTCSSNRSKFKSMQYVLSDRAIYRLCSRPQKRWQLFNSYQAFIVFS
ncbi:MAG: phage integrase N-terminal SAM-like domain-containing protein [Cyanobacteria bacterium J06628_6]